MTCGLNGMVGGEGRCVTVEVPNLPPFRRSVVVRVPADAVEGIVRAH